MLFLPYITNSFAMKFYQVCWSNKMASGYGTSVYILGWRQQKIQTIFITPWLCRFVLGFWGRQQNTTRKSQHTLPQYHHRRPQKSLLKKACLVRKKVGRNVVFLVVRVKGSKAEIGLTWTHRLIGFLTVGQMAYDKW